VKNGIKYMDVTAMPGSILHTLLTDLSSEKDPKKAKELRDKAKQCYTECHQRYQRSVGELSFHGWAPKEAP
jgi:hypothetical protein